MMLVLEVEEIKFNSIKPQGLINKFQIKILNSMAIHLYKTSTPSTCNGAIDSQVKSNTRNNLIYGQHRCGKGRNARGIITARHRGGGHKRLYRKIYFRRNEKYIYGRIVTIEYDPNRLFYYCLAIADLLKRYCSYYFVYVVYWFCLNASKIFNILLFIFIPANLHSFAICCKNVILGSLYFFSMSRYSFLISAVEI